MDEEFREFELINSGEPGSGPVCTIARSAISGVVKQHQGGTAIVTHGVMYLVREPYESVMDWLVAFNRVRRLE